MAQKTAQLTDTVYIPRQNESVTRDPGISILDLLIILAIRKRFIAIVTLLVTALAATQVLCTPDSFKAQAVILPPQQQQSSLSAMASGALSGLAGPGAISLIGLKTPGDLYTGILKSHTISAAIVARFHLQNVYKSKFASDAERTLAANATFQSGKDSLITISVQDYNPQRAAAMANAFVDELHNLTTSLALTGASQRRLFFEQQLRREKDNMSAAEVSLTDVQRSTGLVLPAGQGAALIGSTERLRAEISSLEVALHASQTYATEENPKVQVLQGEIAAMRRQLIDLETKGGESAFEVSVANLPAATLGYVRKVRDLKYHEDLYSLLARQYEAARIDESKEATLIQVIDRASVPDRKSGPQRRAIVLYAGIFGFVLSSIYVLLTHSVKALCSDPKQAESLAALRSALWFHRYSRSER
jgi:uncharacterized protein involved in exopolysaccharide biosynthesis